MYLVAKVFLLKNMSFKNMTLTDDEASIAQNTQIFTNMCPYLAFLTTNI